MNLLVVVTFIVLGNSKEEIESVTAGNSNGGYSGDSIHGSGRSSKTLMTYGYWNWKNIVQKTSGDGWNMWNATSQWESEHTKWSKCRWTTFRATNGQTTKMCIHYNDATSRAIINRGRWADCDILTEQFEETHPDKKHKIYLEVGASIGACVLQILFTTEAPVLAFEPEPTNLFCLTSTIMQLEPRYKDRILLFPFALSDKPGRTKMQVKVGDMGDSFVGDVVMPAKKSALDEAEQSPAAEGEIGYKVPFEVPVERLDDIVNAEHEDIALSKLHAQGHECKVLDGMPKLLPHIKAIHTEIYKHHLKNQGCSGDEYMGRLEEVGFEIQHRQKFLLDEEQDGSVEVLALNTRMGKQHH